LVTVNDTVVIASDLGSGGCKTLLIDGAGRLLAVAQQEYATAYPRPGWAEQNADDWYAAFCGTVRAVLHSSRIDPAQVMAVGIVGVTHNTVLLDNHDRPLCPTIMLFDNRSIAQVHAIHERWGDRIRQQTLNDITPVWSWPQLLWLRENAPDIWSRTRRLMFQKDYVRHRLAPSHVTDTIDASGTLLYDPTREAWIPEFCEDLQLQPAWLPKVVNPMEIVSEVSRTGAADTGLMAGTPVIAGTTDTVAEVLGSGALRAGAACVKLASVGRIAVVSPTPVDQPNVINYRHVLDDLWYPGTASKFAASAFRWLRDILWQDIRDGTAYRQMDTAASMVAPGSDGLLFHPHLMGEWAPHWNERLRASFVGLTMRHTRGHLTRAVLEGVAFGLKDALQSLEQAGVRAESIRLIGQGATSPLWAQIVTNVLDRPLSIPEQSDAAYGSALITAMGINLLPISIEALDAVIRVNAHVQPDCESTKAYAALFEIYRDADQALKSISERLQDFDHGQKRENPL
jgi:xylulokinase